VVNCRRSRYDVYIGPTSEWENPFSYIRGEGKIHVATPAEAFERFREWFLSQPDLVERARRELKGKALGCWCWPFPCHGDIIAEIIDPEEEEDEHEHDRQ
jgi:hypothetical protein